MLRFCRIRVKRARVQGLQRRPQEELPHVQLSRVRRQAGSRQTAAVRRMRHGVSHLLPEPAAHHHPRRRGLVNRFMQI